MTDFDWRYAETVLATCPECNFQVALETDAAEYSGGRCVKCDERLAHEYR